MARYFNSLKLKAIPQKLYHYTHKDNLRAIYLEEKLKSSIANEVYLTHTLIDAKKFSIIYSKINNIDINNYLIIAFRTDTTNINLNNLSISIDHSKETFLGAEAIVHEEDIYIPRQYLEVYNI